LTNKQEEVRAKRAQFVKNFMVRNFPVDHYPKGATNYCGQTVQWYLNDTPKAFARNQPAGFTADNVEYSFNEQGFRTADFADRKEFNILVVGCSISLGLGLPVADTYPDILRVELERRLGKSVQVWNLSAAGKGNDFMVQLLMSLVPQLKPDAVYMHWTGSPSKLYITQVLQRFGIGVYSYPADGNYENYPDESRLVIENHEILDNLTDNSILLAKQLRTIECFLANQGVFHLFSSMSGIYPEKNSAFFPPLFTGVNRLLHADRYTDLFFNYLDRARDNSHFGRKSHRDFALRLADEFADKYNNWQHNRNQPKPEQLATNPHPAPNISQELAIFFDVMENQWAHASGAALDRALPTDRVAPTRLAGRGSSKWLLSDSLQTYKANPHPEYGVDDIDYVLNNEGYRCDDFAAGRADLNLIVAGAGETMALGVRSAESYGQQLAALLTEELGRSVRVWNLGMAGEAGDFVSRIMMSAIPVLRPDLVYIHWPQINGREFFTETGERFSYFPVKSKTDFTNFDPAIAPYAEAINKLGNFGHDLYRFYSNQLLVRELAKAYGAKYFFAGFNHDALQWLSDYDRQPGFTGIDIRRLDAARNRHYPGPLSHRKFAEDLAQLFAPALQAEGSSD
jgi:hypothetical protein